MQNRDLYVSRIFKALSHPIRIAIVKELLKEQRCVKRMEEILKIRQPNISQHLFILKANCLIDCETRGKLRCYFLINRNAVRRLLQTVEEFKTA